MFISFVLKDIDKDIYFLNEHYSVHLKEQKTTDTTEIILPKNKIYMEPVRQFPRQGHEKLRELEELMNGAGLFTEDFDIKAGMGLGDLLDVEEPAPIEGEANPNGDGGDEKGKKPPKDKFPPIDGQLSAAKLVDQYKKTILTQQRAFKELSDKWDAAAPSTGKTLLFCLVEKQCVFLGFVYMGSAMCFLNLFFFLHHQCPHSLGQNLWRCRKLMVPRFFGQFSACFLFALHSYVYKDSIRYLHQYQKTNEYI